MENSYWVSLLVQGAVSSPVYIALIVGIILAAGRRAEARTRYGLMLAAFALFLVLGITGNVINTLLPLMVMRQSWSATQVGGFFGVVGIVTTLLHALAWVLLLVAIFRRPSAQGAVRRVEP